MPNFNPLRRTSDRQKTTRTGRFQKVDGQDIFPQSVPTRQITNEVLENIGSSGVALNWPSGGGVPLVLTTTIQHTKQPDEVRVGVQPFQIVLLQDGVHNTLDNVIPYSATVPWGSWDIIGPLPETDTTASNSKGEVLWRTGSKTKIIVKTYIYNQSGAPHNIIYITGARSFTPQGGQSA